MERIEKTFNYVEEELHDAKKYAKCAMQAKMAGDMERFAIAMKLADAELEHSAMWYDYIRTKAKEMRSKYEVKGEKVPDYIDMRLQEMTDHYAEEMAEVRYLIDTNKR